MTPTQLEHLKRIDAHLEGLLDIASKRTPGEWYAQIFPSLQEAYDDGEFEWTGGNSEVFPKAVGSVWQGDENSITGLPGCIEVGADNATFIASCAGNAEAGWRATRAAIASLLLIAQFELDGRTVRDESLNGRNAEKALESILAAFPLKLIQKP